MLIGISGKMGSGKSTAIEAMKTLGKPVYVHKFAAPLYQIQEQIYRIIAPVYQRPEDFVKDRKLLQWIGTDWGRETIRESLWIDLWKSRAEMIKTKDPTVTLVSDDTRYDNEAEMIHSMGGVVIEITRSDSTQHAVGGEGIKNHKSESGISPHLIDYRITNDGTLEEFQEAFKVLIKQIESEQAA